MGMGWRSRLLRWCKAMCWAFVVVGKTKVGKGKIEKKKTIQFGTSSTLTWRLTQPLNVEEISIRLDGFHTNIRITT